MKNKKFEAAVAGVLIVIMLAAAAGQAAAVVTDYVEDHRQMQKSLHVQRYVICSRRRATLI